MTGQVVLGLVKAQQQQQQVPVQVGVIVYDEDNWNGKMGLSCIQMALSDFYASHPNSTSRLVLNTREYPKDSVIGAAASALDLIKNVQVEAIIGPITSMEAEFVTHLGREAQVPIISYSATSPFLSSTHSQYFIRATQADPKQAPAISALVQAFGWREVALIYTDSQFGAGLMPHLADALQDINTKVAYRSVIPPSATNDQITIELQKLMMMQTRVFILHMAPDLGSRLLLKAKQVGMMEKEYIWITTTGMGNQLKSQMDAVIEFMQGVIGVQTYVPKTEKLKDVSRRWKQKFLKDNPNSENLGLDVIGLHAYDAAWALASVVERVHLASSSFIEKTNSTDSIDLETLGVSENGPRLVKEISESRFRGVAGDFKIVDRQLDSSTYRIINVIGNGYREIGFWTPEKGLIRDLNPNSNSTYSTSKNSLGTIIWPGDPTGSVPKGWVIPTNQSKLRVGVPVRQVYTEFVMVTTDSDTNTTAVTGYCIDVFEAAMAKLPYYVPFEYIPYVEQDGIAAGSYNDFVYQVYLQKFDAAVGDTTITANRTQYADFTFPFTDSGVTMVVPISGDKKSNAWAFLQPLTWDLWLTSLCFFIFIAFVIWLLEHRINEDFRGPPSHQVGTTLYNAFSMIVFAQKSNMLNNWSRFVAIIWVFVVFILTQSYTASLTSMLTVQQLQPTVTDPSVLMKKGEYVGFQEGSFVKGLLIELGFQESKLRSYNTTEQLNEFLSKGSSDGGIAAVFDEIPYMKFFLAKYCSNYTMVQPTYKTIGFGFAFTRGSPLVPDVSRGVLEITEGDEMRQIEKEWSIDQRRCQLDSENSVSSSSGSLALSSFWGLFLIAGIASGSALVVSTAIFVYNHRRLWIDSDKASIWERVYVMARAFDQPDLSSHTFRKTEPFGPACRFGPVCGGPGGMGFMPFATRNTEPYSRSNTRAVSCSGCSNGTTANSTCPPSPSCYSSNPEECRYARGVSLSP